MRSHPSLLALLLPLLACTSLPDEAADPIDECATCDGKADGLDGPCDADIVVTVANSASFDELDIAARLNARAAENIVDGRPFAALAEVDAISFVGSSSLTKMLEYGLSEGLTCQGGPCDTDVVVTVANTASFEELDDDVGLNARAARGLVDGRPFSSVEEVDAVSFVGASALERIREFGIANGQDCNAFELALISDLDKTVIPPQADDLPLPPYPGVSTLYNILLGDTGEITYVTARNAERVVLVPNWLERHDVPVGTIETGISGIPSVARREKVSDITRTFEASPNRVHVLFGDTSHVDPEVSQDVLGLFPNQVRAALMHKVTDTVSPDRLLGLHLFHNHVEAAVILARLRVIGVDEAIRVFEAATNEGLDLSLDEFHDLLIDNGL